MVCRRPRTPLRLPAGAGAAPRGGRYVAGTASATRPLWSARRRALRTPGAGILRPGRPPTYRSLHRVRPPPRPSTVASVLDCMATMLWYMAALDGIATLRHACEPRGFGCDDRMCSVTCLLTGRSWTVRARRRPRGPVLRPASAVADVSCAGLQITCTAALWPSTS